MKIFLISAILFLTHTSEASIFDNSLNDFDCSGGNSIDIRCQVNASYTPADCICQNQCPECGYKPDPNNPLNGYIECKTDSPKNCAGNLVFDSATCKCISCPTCKSVPDPFNSPSGFLNCIDGSPSECPRQIYNSKTCGCEACPTSGFVADPFDAPSGGFDCKANPIASHGCPSAIYDVATGGCKACPSSCDYISDPYNAPSGFIRCKDECRCQCTSGQSFDSSTCSCVSTPVDPCAKCGYYAYPGDTTKYYKCVSGGADAACNCPSGFYFNPDSCYCEGTPPTTTSTPKTTTKSSDPCANCGYYEYPGDNTKYYKCLSGGGTAVANCPTGFTFNPNTCYCE